MTQYIDKSAVVEEVKDLYEDIDKCIGDLVLAKSKHDQRGISDAHWKMETLMVNIQQALSYILQHLEVKEVDLELITGWFDHIAQIADDRMTLTNKRMTDAHALDEIKCLAKDSSEFIKMHCKSQKGE